MPVSPGNPQKIPPQRVRRYGVASVSGGGQVFLQTQPGIVDGFCVIAAHIAVVPGLKGNAGDILLPLGEAENESEFPCVFRQPGVGFLPREGHISSTQIVHVTAQTGLMLTGARPCGVGGGDGLGLGQRQGRIRLHLVGGIHVEQGILTYEDILLLPVESIVTADYRNLQNLSCIYVEAIDEENGYLERYWVDVASGLLVAAEKEYQSSVIYRMAALEIKEEIADVSAFTLPDKTVLWNPMAEIRTAKK